MRVRWRRRIAPSGARTLLGALLLLGTACQSEEDSDPTERYCDALCARAVQCDLADGSCNGYCNESANLEPLRDDAAEHLASCISSQACYDLTSEETFEACWDEMEGSVAATEYGRKFCVTYATHVFSCGYEFSAQACEAAFGIFADEALERLTTCTHEPCDRLDACQSRTLWGER